MTAWEWFLAAYAAIGAAFGGHCMVEVERETPGRRPASPAYVVACIGAAIVVGAIWLPLTISVILERNDRGE